jgi:hypothetical protein
VLAITLALCACGGPRPADTHAAAVAASATAGPAARRSPTPAAAPSPAPAPTAPVPHPAVAAGWVGPIYAPHLHGYDVSYPQCSGARAPAGAGFSVIGVNDGRAFSINPCFRSEWQAAAGTRAVYFNSGYEPDNAAQATADCLGRSQYQTGGATRQMAYAIGCSEAVFAVNTLALEGAGRTVMIWLDVEEANSWDLSDLDLNQTSLQAEIDELAAYGRVVGLYGTFAQWHEILGDWQPQGVVADWLAGQQPGAVCGTDGFSGHPVWVVQELDTWSGVDSDWTC